MFFQQKKWINRATLLLEQKTLKGRLIHMHSITQQIIDSIAKFSEVNFKFSKYMVLFLLLKTIPDTITLLLNTDDFIYHLSEANSHLTWLNEFFESNILPTIRKRSGSSKTILRMSCRNMPTSKVDKKPPVFSKPMDLSDQSWATFL